MLSSTHPWLASFIFGHTKLTRERGLELDKCST